MRLGWNIPLPGPFFLSGTIWRSRSRRQHVPRYHGTLTDGWKCPHFHLREDTANACAAAELRRRRRAAG